MKTSEEMKFAVRNSPEMSKVVVRIKSLIEKNGVGVARFVFERVIVEQLSRKNPELVKEAIVALEEIIFGDQEGAK